MSNHILKETKNTTVIFSKFDGELKQGIELTFEMRKEHWIIQKSMTKKDIFSHNGKIINEGGKNLLKRFRFQIMGKK